jgi:GTPase SAR1 family protein
MSKAPPKYIEKLLPFFKEGVDFSKVAKPADIVNLEVKTLKAFNDDWVPFFEDLDLKTIKDLSQFNEPLTLEGLDPDETNKLAMIAEMIFWRVTQIAEKGDQKKKIVLFGLGNAGKTSALTALSERYSAIKQLLPTRGLVRQSMNIFGYDIMSFDMGGQEEYQKTYFDKADMYFSPTDLMIYCIDIQDNERFKDSIEYFKNITDKYLEYQLHPPILVVFTKFDPDLINDEQLNKGRIELIDQIEKVCAEKFDVAYTNSSIYDRNSIESLFSLALKRISTSSAVIIEFLRQFTQDIGARSCALISSSGLIFGSYGETEQEEEMLNNSASYLQNLYLFQLANGGLQREDFYMLEYKRNNLFFISEYIASGNAGMVYLWVLTSDLRSETVGIAKFREEILPLIEIFL